MNGWQYQIIFIGNKGEFRLADLEKWVYCSNNQNHMVLSWFEIWTWLIIETKQT